MEFQLCEHNQAPQTTEREREREREKERRPRTPPRASRSVDSGYCVSTRVFWQRYVQTRTCVHARMCNQFCETCFSVEELQLLHLSLGLFITYSIRYHFYFLNCVEYKEPYKRYSIPRILYKYY
jgi:hypothetical protein